MAKVSFKKAIILAALLLPSAALASTTYTRISLSGGIRGSLNYAIVDEYIIVSNSRSCIDETIKQLYYADTD